MVTDWMSMYPEAPITDNMVEFKAKEILLQDKAAEMEAKTLGSGKGMMLLSTMAQKTYYEYFGQVLSIDLNLDGENQTQSESARQMEWLGGCHVQWEVKYRRLSTRGGI